MAACLADLLWLPTEFPRHRHFFTKFLPSPSNDLTEDPAVKRGDERKGMKEISREKVAPASFKKHNTTHSEATASETEPEKKKEKKKPQVFDDHISRFCFHFCLNFPLIQSSTALPSCVSHGYMAFVINTEHDRSDKSCYKTSEVMF